MDVLSGFVNQAQETLTTLKGAAGLLGVAAMLYIFNMIGHWIVLLIHIIKNGKINSNQAGYSYRPRPERKNNDAPNNLDDDFYYDGGQK